MKKVFNGEIIRSHGQLTCSRCGERLYYAYIAYNLHNGSSSAYGLECLIKDGVEIYHEGSRIKESEAKKHLRNLYEKLRKKLKKIDSFILLSRLLNRENKKERKNAISKIRKKVAKGEALRPRELNFILWRLEKNNLPSHASLFSLCLDKKGQKEAADLELYQIQRIRKAATSKQKKKIDEILKKLGIL